MSNKGIEPNKGGGEGERAGKARRKRISGIVALLMITGGIVGALTTGFDSNQGAGLMRGTLPPWVAITASVLLVVVLTFGSWKFFQIVDEVELRDNYIGNTAGLYFYFTAYVVWYLLWRGTLVPEPGHELLFAGTFVAMLLAYLWKKVRP